MAGAAWAVRGQSLPADTSIHALHPVAYLSRRWSRGWRLHAPAELEFVRPSACKSGTAWSVIGLSSVLTRASSLTSDLLNMHLCLAGISMSKLDVYGNTAY